METGYFVNTTSGTITVTLYQLSPTAGDVVAFKDYASQLGNTNAVTLCNNGNKINGICGTASLKYTKPISKFNLC
jgi:hypothetical protein